MAALALAYAPAALADKYTPDHTPLPASVTNGSGSAAPIGTGSSLGMVARTVVGLAIVLAVVYGIYWLLKTTTRARMADSGGRIEVLATTQLAANRTLHLVRCGDEVILVGAGEAGVTPLRVYAADEAAFAGLTTADEPVLLPAAEPATPRRWLSPVGTLRAWTVRA